MQIKFKLDEILGHIHHWLYSTIIHLSDRDYIPIFLKTEIKLLP
jgi:hypothetical protein